MVGVEFLEQISKLQVASYVGVEDFADKFNFLITVLVIMLCTTTVTVKQYMMKPISCYMATDIGGRNLLDYVENYCWVQGTIPISYSSKIPDDEASWKELNSKKLLYYQWVPFVLGLQCILFYLPRLIWQMICYNRSGTDVQHLVTSASQAVHSNEEQRTKLVKHLAKTLEQMLFQQHLKKWFLQQKSQQRNNDACSSQVRILTAAGGYDDQEPTTDPSLSFRLRCCVEGRWIRFRLGMGMGSHSGFLFSSLYFMVKLLYLANSLGQVFLLQKFLHFSASDLFNLLVFGHDWESTLLFPRVGFCVAPIRHLGTDANYATAQCVLPVNMLNEKIFLFLWMWISLVSGLNLWSTLRCLIRFLYTKPERDQIRGWLRIREVYNESQENLFEEFSRQFLRHDGMFITRLLLINAGELLATEVIQILWEEYLKRASDEMLNPKINRKISITQSRSATAPTEKQLLTEKQVDSLSNNPMHTFTGDFV